MKNKVENKQNSEQLNILAVSGSFSPNKLEWKSRVDKVLGDLYEAETPLPSNFNKSRYEIRFENYDNQPKRYVISLFCGNQGHPICKELWINNLNTAKEHAQYHFNELVMKCLTEIKNF